MEKKELEFLNSIAKIMPCITVDSETFDKVTEIIGKNGTPYKDDVESFIENNKNLDIGYIIKGIDEDLQKSIIPILQDINIILKYGGTNEEGLYTFNFKLEQLKEKQCFECLDKDLKDFIKSGYEEVGDRIYEILFNKN